MLSSCIAEVRFGCSVVLPFLQLRSYGTVAVGIVQGPVLTSHQLLAPVGAWSVTREDGSGIV
jgi:hypothetical protein